MLFPGFLCDLPGAVSLPFDCTVFSLRFETSGVLSNPLSAQAELQSLLLNSLYGLSKLDLPETFVKSVFEMRAACLAGYTPDLFGCHICGSQNPDRFDLSAGQLSCRGCASGEHGIRMPVTAGMLEAMRYVCLCDPKRLFSFQIGEQTLEQLSSLTESYLQTQLERGFSALDFYKSLLM
ncbi:MAG: DNA repair protein RecO C-terminal domain-containing protein [Ruminococcus sp.]|nr:DNA repair protein RecO C-terminal domain-containing protein [Ruminococcus sp.]